MNEICAKCFRKDCTVRDLVETMTYCEGFEPDFEKSRTDARKTEETIHDGGDNGNV